MSVKGSKADICAYLTGCLQSPFVKVATLHIPKQDFRRAERDEMSDRLAFSPDLQAAVGLSACAGPENARTESFDWIGTVIA
jgi:hypothetical protein